MYLIKLEPDGPAGGFYSTVCFMVYIITLQCIQWWWCECGCECFVSLEKVSFVLDTPFSCCYFLFFFSCSLLLYSSFQFLTSSHNTIPLSDRNTQVIENCSLFNLQCVEWFLPHGGTFPMFVITSLTNSRWQLCCLFLFMCNQSLLEIALC